MCCHIVGMGTDSRLIVSHEKRIQIEAHVVRLSVPTRCGAECQTADTHEWHAAACYKEHRRGTRDYAAERARQFCHPEKDG